MDQFGSQMRSYAAQDGAFQRPQSQPAQPNGNAKPATGPGSKQHPNGCADVKPRLTKEQHDILENHFQQQHKPSTTTKKGFAETLGVPVDKINNWFQNRRAKVKQDLKKQMNQYNMNMGLYGPTTTPVPLGNSHYPVPNEQPQAQPRAQDFYHVPMTADISPTCLPVQSVEHPSALELGSQMPLHQQFDMNPNMLRSIPEADRSTQYHPNAVLQSFMAATAGASYMHSNPAALPPQESGFSYDTTGLPQAFSTDLAFSVPSTLPNENATSNDIFNGLSDFSGLDYASTLTVTTTSGSADIQNSAGTVSSEPSPFSGAQSSATTHSSGAPNGSSVTSIASMYSGWTDENAGADMKPSNVGDESFDSPYALPQASSSEQALPFWAQNGPGQSFSPADMYRHGNGSAHAILSSPGQHERNLSAGPPDLEAPPSFGDDVYSRRNSSTTNLANNIEAIHIQNTTPDGFTQPNQPSSIAARRHKRPTALNPSSFRSASYGGGMPSPGNNEHTLRRIRSSGIPNAAGRVQKPTPGSAQRSPMTQTFADAAASPKFARAFSSSSTAGAAQGGSLAPPTPLTPNEMQRFPYWQSNAVFRNHAPMPEHSSPESMNANWAVDPQSAGLHGSPPSTPLGLGHLNQARFANDSLYRDTPPQSAPATQQSFPRTSLMAPPQMKSGFHSATDLTIAQPKPSHFRRPSLPDGGHPPLDDPHMQFPVQYGDAFYDLSLDGVSHNVPFAPPAVMPEFLVHEYTPAHPAGPATLMRRTTEPPPKSYIFANQGPRDFKQ